MRDQKLPTQSLLGNRPFTPWWPVFMVRCPVWLRCVPSRPLACTLLVKPIHQSQSFSLGAAQTCPNMSTQPSAWKSPQNNPGYLENLSFGRQAAILAGVLAALQLRCMWKCTCERTFLRRCCSSFILSRLDSFLSPFLRFCTPLPPPSLGIPLAFGLWENFILARTSLGLCSNTYLAFAVQLKASLHFVSLTADFL